jgi:hypothetical protein
VFGGPEDNHSFQQRGARTADGNEEIEIGPRYMVWRVAVQMNAILCGRDIKEAHFSTDVV